MTLDDKILEIKKKHDGGIKTLLSIFLKNKRLIKSKQLWASITISILVFLILIFVKNNIDLFDLLVNLINRILSVLPNILGFTLTGYALLVSFGNDNFMKEVTIQEDEGYSFYQHFSSIFAWSIIIQASALFVAFVFSIIADFHITSKHSGFYNLFAFFLLTFLSIYSLLLVIRLVLNVFSFGQVIQFHYTALELEKQEKYKKKQLKTIKDGTKNT